jgi:hypothetical protein
MISWKVRVIREDGTQDVFPVRPKTIVAFERNFKIGLSNAFTKEQKQEHVYWLGWDAEKSSGRTVKPFDSWLDSIVTVEIEAEKIPLDETA